MYLEGPYFKDNKARTLLLRGVNLGGSNKVPAEPNLPTHQKYGFYDEKKISFVGRPFPLKDADEHFRRLKSWGLTFVRFLITWEAIEPLQPGEYDTEYLDYIYEIIKKAGEYDIQVFIDPHQDVWSRFSGGDGAPRWTFEKVGLDVKQFAECGAAILHQHEGDSLPEMIWPTNYTKMASATMFTLFFGGNDFAPLLKIDNEPAQDYLQRHYFNAITQVAKKLKSLKNVVGYDIMNEPSKGWIGWKDLNSNDFIFKKGASPSPFQCMSMASGFPRKVENWEITNRGLKMRGMVEVNPRGIRAWKSGLICIWKMHGIWDVETDGQPVLLKPDYFSVLNGRVVDFSRDYLMPFINKYAQTIRAVKKDALIFAEFPLGEGPVKLNHEDAENLVNAAHWYDGVTLLTKNFRPWLSYDLENKKLVFGRKKVRKLFVHQLANIKKEGIELMDNAPTLIGETGIPFDMKKKKAYRTGKFSLQEKALDATIRALEENLLSFTLWNYTADNSNVYGDQWNKEDLSIFSRDQQSDKSDINSGGRALNALLRPYPMRTAGKPVRLFYDMKKKVFEFEFEHDEKVKAPTEIFVPNYLYPNGYKVFVTDGNYDIDIENQLLIYNHSVDRFKHSIKIIKH